MSDNPETFDGGCACGHVRYRVASPPMIVHCCHCRLCQRQNGSAFAVNALLEADRVTLLQGEVVEITVPSPSGKNQRIARCSKCQVALWSNYLVLYGGIGELVRFVRVGTLDDPGKMPPDVHIHTSSKQPWVVLPPDALVFEEYYGTKEVWSDESLERRAELSALVRKK
ncbi:MAG: GFA family protein [Gammaproteobacteria bacterium]|nr:GFA family protein [Gammaproteobacteria bacterium]MDH5617197.1 GFA family protein [Gammaproteobacteria bacterium]